jgi:hypothetical protein
MTFGVDLEALLRLAERSEPVEVDAILKPASGVIEREIAHLPVDASSVERDRPGSGSEGADDGADRLVVELEARHLGEDGLLPRLVAVPRLLAP